MAKTLPPKLTKELINFFETFPPGEFSFRLRTVLLYFIRYELKVGMHSPWLPDFISCIQDLLDILDTAEQELNKKKTQP